MATGLPTDLNARITLTVTELTSAAETLTTLNELNPGEGFTAADMQKIKDAKVQALTAFRPITEARGCVQE
jgi:hypothetical protein